MGLRAANMYIVSVENRETLRTDGPHRVSGLAPTSRILYHGNFASGPPRPLEPRPEPSRNRPKQKSSLHVLTYMFEPVYQQMKAPSTDIHVRTCTSTDAAPCRSLPLLAAPCRSLPDAPALKTVDFLVVFIKNSIPFQSRPLLAARSRTPRHSEPLIVLILIRNRYFFSPGRSLPLAPGRPGTRNR